MKEVKYTKDVGERLKQKRDRMSFPRIVFFEITHRCNLHCRHCYIVPEETKKELSTQEVKSIFEQLVEAGCLHLVLTGGEPLLRKDILSLINYARRIGLFIHLFTNAALVTSKIADKLKEFQLISLGISLHSLKKERFDWFTQVEGSFDKVMKAIKLLRERKLKFTLKVDITKANLDEIEDFQAFVKDLEVIPEWTTFLIPRLDGRRDNLFLRLEPEQVWEVRDRLYPESYDDGDTPEETREDKEFSCAGISEKETKRNGVRDKLFQCGAGKKGLTISPYGELKPCPELPSPVHSILDVGLKEGWKKIGDFVESFKPSPEYKCFDCRLRDFCSSCPAKARLECGDMNCCPDYCRRLAELTAQRQAKITKLLK